MMGRDWGWRGWRATQQLVCTAELHCVCPVPSCACPTLTQEHEHRFGVWCTNVQKVLRRNREGTHKVKVGVLRGRHGHRRVACSGDGDV